ncbi:HDOD domain-containing protein [Pseudomonas citronellolis]|uniref:HDOD domain-containing protein n=1 Tax=Pseudomonas citronellolis TaxID=53408 RepID=UPI0023E43663|nr:HDOD domain-containing protein [Pseudomonas citronellolis]MDF3936849.1 HDOD domain-containing protein [Pseudomonas citronellolis]
MNAPSAVPDVLIAAADPWNRELLGQLVLSVRGDASVTYCEDGFQAIDACRQGRFGLVLAEQELPGQDGIDLLRHLRHERSQAGTPAFILISAKADAASVRAVRPLAPSAYLVKPFNAEDLRQRLRSLLLAPGQEIGQRQPAKLAGSLAELLSRARESAEGAPLLGDVGAAVSRCLGGDETSLEQLEQEFGRDPQITACLIAAANSAARHVGMPCLTLAQALSRLGLAQACNLVLGLSLERAAQLGEPRLKVRAEQFWALSQRSADAAQALAESLEVDAARCYTAGLLHCLGELAVLRTLDEWCRGGGELGDEEIDESLRSCAAGFGSALRMHWRLPLELRGLIAACYGVGGGVFSRKALILNLAARAVRLPPSQAARLKEEKALRMLGLEPAQVKLLQGFCSAEEPPAPEAPEEDGVS